MKNQLLALNETSFKQLVITDSEILYTSTPHPTLASLLESKEKPGTLEFFCRIALAEIEAVEYNEQEETLHIFYRNRQGHAQEERFRFADVARRIEIAQYLSATLGLRPLVRTEQPTMPLLGYSLLVLFIFICTLYARNISIQVQDGRRYDFAGSRKNIVGLLHALGEHLSPAWVTAVGLAIAAVVAYFGYQRFKNPAQVHVFEK